MAPQSIPELFLFAVELLRHPLYLRSTPEGVWYHPHGQHHHRLFPHY
jgi:hypothetical protein